MVRRELNILLRETADKLLVNRHAAVSLGRFVGPSVLSLP